MAGQVSEEEIGGMWLIDNGCSNHIPGNKELFETLESTLQHTVRLGDGKEMKVVGIGTVLFCSSTRKVSKLTRVQYVPQLAHNLLSMGQLMLSGYSIAFLDGECKIVDKHANTLRVCVQMINWICFLWMLGTLVLLKLCLVQVKNPSFGIGDSNT